jgi:hypothetical protein
VRLGIEIASKIGSLTHLETLTLEDWRKIIATDVPGWSVRVAGI